VVACDLVKLLTVTDCVILFIRREHVKLSPGRQ